MRFDDEVRSERYFTATLLPLVLFYGGFEGLRSFIDLIEKEAATEFDGRGEKHPKGVARYNYADPEVITEFHVARDLRFGNLIDAEALLPSEENGAPDRRDAPDLVIVAGREVVVCEAKFFVHFTRDELNSQLQSQRKQITHLFRARPDLRAYRHVAIIPKEFDTPLDCSAVVTWADIANLSGDTLGDDHYVTRRLRNAVERYKLATEGRGIRNYDGQQTLDEVLTRCRQLGNEISVGHMGGEKDLRKRGHAYSAAKRWKWRLPATNRGVADRYNWIGGEQFVRVIESMPPDGTEIGGGETS